MTGNVPTVLFVCTGNVFRSLSAERALRRAFNEQAHCPHPALHFASAGTHGNPHKTLRADVLAALARQGVDGTTHTPRLLDRAIVDSATVIIAMDKTHRDYIRKTFNREAHLFMQVAHFIDAGVPDLPDVIPDHRRKPAEAAQFVTDTVNMIFAARHRFLRNLNLILPPPAPADAPRPA